MTRDRRTIRNGTVRSRLSVHSMTAMTQIHQYYKTEEKVHLMILILILLITVTHWQSRLHAKSKPSVKFFDIKNRFFSKSGNADENPDDDEDDSWLDVPDINVFPPEDSLHVSSNINLSSQCLAAALSEEPIGNMTASETSQPNPQEAPGEPSELDDDFSMYL